MVRYTTFADVTDENLQNLQEWAKTWGEIRHEFERFDGEVIDAYAVLGEHDFQITYEVPDEEAAMKISVAIERYGLDTQTHQLVGVERMGELTDDI